MFTAVQTKQQKKEVLKLFSQKDGKLRMILATTAFGMGMDCPDVRRIICWGLPSTVEEYVQEIGWSGRDVYFKSYTI